MLFRLNFLVFCVMAVTDHVFVRYYICAMHTYWFLSVWLVMVALNRYNKVCRHFSHVTPLFPHNIISK